MKTKIFILFAFLSFSATTLIAQEERTMYVIHNLSTETEELPWNMEFIPVASLNGEACHKNGFFVLPPLSTLLFYDAP